MKSLAIIPLVLAIMLAAVPAARAGDTSCTGQLFGTINGNVVVPQGATCELTTATVTGNVLVEKGASLLAGPQGSVTISGNVLAIQCASVTIEPSALVSIGGSVGILFCTGTSGYFVRGVSIQGNFLCQFNSAPCTASSGSIGGSVDVSQNSGGTSTVLGNQIDGNLICFRNTAVTDDGIPNTVAGKKLGQCAGL